MDVDKRQPEKAKGFFGRAKKKMTVRINGRKQWGPRGELCTRHYPSIKKAGRFPMRDDEGPAKNLL